MFLVFFTFDKTDTYKLIKTNTEIIKPNKTPKTYTYENYFKQYYKNNENQYEKKKTI
jgi:hypothetical protein